MAHCRQAGARRGAARTADAGGPPCPAPHRPSRCPRSAPVAQPVCRRLAVAQRARPSHGAAASRGCARQPPAGRDGLQLSGSSSARFRPRHCRGPPAADCGQRDCRRLVDRLFLARHQLFALAAFVHPIGDQFVRLGIFTGRRGHNLAWPCIRLDHGRRLAGTRTNQTMAR